MSISPFFVHFFHNLVEKIVEKFMSVLVHSASEEVVQLLQFLDERFRGNGPLLAGLGVYVIEQGPQRGE